MKIDNKNFIDKNLISTYEEVDGLTVIEELLLFKGVEIVDAKFTVSKKALDDTAIYVYRLKVNSTTRLYIGLALDRFYRRADLIKGNRIKVPTDIYNKVKAINDSYKKAPEFKEEWEQ